VSESLLVIPAKVGSILPRMHEEPDSGFRRVTTFQFLT